MVRKVLKIGLFGALTVFGTGCLAPQSDGVAGLIAATASSTTTSTVTTGSGDLYLIVSSAWETTPDSYVTQISCSVPSGSATGTAVTCSGKIPEGQLYFSNLKFTVGTTSSNTCHTIVFRPYYYVASTAAAYTPPGSTSAVDCSVLPLDGSCYNGAAKEIVPSFPDYSGVYFLTSTGNEADYTISSGNTLQQGTNRYTCNNKVDKTAAVAGYVANTMQDYVLECRDEYYELQRKITLTIGDYDTGPAEDPGGASDHFDDWLAP
ncbi:MAG: hypothetical protein JST04_02475 [Bdellovibrionales bacterium]|nr:hypothetical protein [Bdellovibrionales bacterium]